MVRVFILLCLSIGYFTSFGQSYFPSNGMKEVAKRITLFKNANIITRYDSQPKKLDMLVVDDKIVEIGERIQYVGAQEVNLEGYYIYPSFIDLYSDYGIKTSERKPSDAPQYETNKTGPYHWNETIKSEINAFEKVSIDNTKREKYLKNGIATVMTQSMDGIARGTGSLVFMANNNMHSLFLQEKAAQCLSFSKGSSNQKYPSSMMGSIALIRQTYYDAQWYAKQKEEPLNLSLESWNNNLKLPAIFDVGNDPFNILRATEIAKEFNQQYILKSTGKEYRILDAIKSTNATLIVPVNFPKVYEVETVFDMNNIFLSQLKHWELAPYNPALLSLKQIPFVFTSYESLDGSAFLDNIRKSVELGLSSVEALKALTFLPANLLGVYDKVGSLANGKVANFFISEKPIFDSGATIFQHYVLGIKEEIKPFKETFKEGNYVLSINDKEYSVEVKEKTTKLKVGDSLSLNTTIQRIGNQLNININSTIDSLEFQKGSYLLFGWQKSSDIFNGTGKSPDGKTIKWTLNLKSNIESEEKDKEKTEKTAIPLEEVLTKIIYPFESYGRKELPKTQRVLFKNATVWTNEMDGIIENTDVLIDNGKIVSISKDIKDADAIIVDATNKHLTAGIIDEHSHISISGGVNEGSQSSTAEVRIGDVIRNDDVNMYRQLAGGVVAAQLLHGSANAIGGQSAIIKFRWGMLPEEMKIKGIAGHIKFALGENVKQSNWGSNYATRYPQSRMGVEQIFREYFTRAKEYMLNNQGRKDLEMDALVEILQKKRFITCHSYVQSEINMLMKVAEDFGFRINIFTHVLEGFKVADKLKNHGASASTFADWWAYKTEVMDAIPYNAAILNKVGVLTALNSDDAEMGRRLNQEAAKVIKYGEVSEEDAWKMVTLNPAKMLKINHLTGSIKVGKDADLVLWSHNPLSVYAVAEMTFVDGIKYFDRKEDVLLREENVAERHRLIQKMILEKKSGAATQKPEIIIDEEYHCDDIKYWEDE